MPPHYFFYFMKFFRRSCLHAHADLRGGIALADPRPRTVAEIDPDAVDRDAGVALSLEMLGDFADHFRFLIVSAGGAPGGGLEDCGEMGERKKVAIYMLELVVHVTGKTMVDK